MNAAKPPHLPPDVAQRFVEDMQAYFAEENGDRRDEIVLRQLHALWQYQSPHAKALRLSDIRRMFEEMRDLAG